MRYGVLRFTIGGVIRDVPIEDTSVIVGRAEGHGIRLDHASVSRRHARVAVDGGRLTVEDLGSVGGVFVDGVRIPPHAPTLLPPGKSLRIGAVEAELVPVSAGVEAGNGGPSGGTAAAIPRARLQVHVNPPVIEVDPGDTAEVAVRIANRGTVVDEIAVTVGGIPADWIDLSDLSLRLRPGEEGQATLRLAPPRSPNSQARDYTVTVSIASQSGRAAAEQASATLSVRPYHDTQLELRPLRSGGNFTVRADNRGNRRASFALDGMDEEGFLVFDFDPPVLNVEPAGEARARLRVRHPKRGLFGRPTVAPFSVLVRSEGGAGAEERLDGQLQVAPPLERYKRFFIVLILIALAAALAALIYFVIGRDWNWSAWPPWKEESPASAIMTPTPPSAGTDEAVAATLTALAVTGSEETATAAAGGTAVPSAQPTEAGSPTVMPTATPIPTPTPTPQAPPAGVSRENLVAEYLFSGNLKDSSGGGDHGSATGNPTFITDRFGNGGRALRFDGNDAVVFNRGSFSSRNEVSISLWIRLSDVNAGLSYFVMSSAFGVFTSGDQAGLAIFLPSTNSALGKIAANEWYHILGTYDGQTIRTYIDGVLTQETSHPGVMSDLERPLTLGLFGRTFWKGTLDDLRIYDRVINDPDEIKALFGEDGFLKFRSPILRPTLSRSPVVAPILDSD